ncbi:MAG TPA: hypothetical protein VMT04_10135 [Terriglobales bacterium]|nr:hypothetical protein [Terriglobales bacterium]
MRKKIIICGAFFLILACIAGCTKNKFKLTRSEPTDMPYYNPVNDTCFICHNVSTLKKTITTSLGVEAIPLYVNRDKFARSLHRGQNCQDCHTDIVLHKGHPDVPKTYGGWANFSAETSTDSTDMIPTRNYTTAAAIACPKCHQRSSFFSSQHYLIGKIKASHSEPMGGIQIGRDYDKAKCGKCHLTCATCHFKGTRIQKLQDDVTISWGHLLNGGSQTQANDMTTWSIDWTTNVESHDFAIAEDLEGSNDLCRMCHTGYYTAYNTKGYYHPDSLPYFDTLVTQSIQNYPKFEEWEFLSGNISVMTGTNPALDSIYSEVINQPHSSRLCLDCHSSIHSLSRIRCLDCHSDKQFSPGSLHGDVGCEACHDATMKTFRVTYSKFPPADTVRAGAVRDNQVIDWRSHMIIRPANIPSFCIYKCHNSAGQSAVGAPIDFEIREIHSGGDK